MDLTPTLAPKSNQVNADDLITGPRTITITRVTAGNAEQPVAVHYEGDNKPWYPCKSMRRVLVAAWGADASTYVGRRVTLIRDPDVMYGGIKVGGIRISHLSDLDSPLSIALTVTRQKRAPYKVQPLPALPAAPARAPSEDPAAGALRACQAAGLTPAGLAGMCDELSGGETTELAQLPPAILTRLAKNGVSAESAARWNAAGESADDPDDLPATWTQPEPATA
jgi:hypothetical protein